MHIKTKTYEYATKHTFIDELATRD